MSAGSLPGSMRPRTPRYQDFIDGVKLALSLGDQDAEVTIKVFCELLESADKLETQVNSYHKPNTNDQEYESLENLILGYYNNRVLGESLPEWMKHSGVPEKL